MLANTYYSNSARLISYPLSAKTTILIATGYVSLMVKVWKFTLGLYESKNNMGTIVHGRALVSGAVL